MNIAEPVFVLTYDCPHRKTYDTLTLLNAKGFKNVTVFCHPMTYMKTFRPLLQHRPPIVHDIDTQTLCKNLGFRYISLQSVNGLSDYVNDIGETPVLIVGAGLIPDVLLNTIVFINAHPGYSPYARGLDAFKWSLLKNLPIGVTVHTVKGNEEEKRREEKRRETNYADTGLYIMRIVLQPTEADSFHSMAYKVYEHEVALLVQSLELYKNALKENRIIEPLPDFPSTRRMPNDLERTLDLTLKSYHCNPSQYPC